MRARAISTTVLYQNLRDYTSPRVKSCESLSNTQFAIIVWYAFEDNLF